MFSEEILNLIIEEFPFATFETIYVTLITGFLAFLIGLPLGIILVVGQKDGINPLPPLLMKALNLIINILRSIPFLILIILVIPFTRLVVGTSVGTEASIVPLVIASFPFVSRLVEGSLREVDQNLIEAAQSMGASSFELVTKVMVPEAVPSLINNGTVFMTTILGYSAMSGVVGGGGLGKIAINYGYYRYEYEIMILAVVLLVILVGIIQAIGNFLNRKFDKRIS